MDNKSALILTDTEKLVLRELTTGVIDNDSVTGNEYFINKELGMTIDEFMLVAENINKKVLLLLP